MSSEWVEEIVVQCETAAVPLFFKQWGGVNKKKTGRLLNGRTYDELPLEAGVRRLNLPTLNVE